MSDTPLVDALDAVDPACDEPQDEVEARDWQAAKRIAMLHMARTLERRIALTEAAIDSSIATLPRFGYLKNPQIRENLELIRKILRGGS